MNKKNVALILGLIANIVPACCAEEVQAPVQEPVAQVCTENACEVTPVAEATPEVAPVEPATVETAPAPTDACQVQPEEELTEEQLKELLDQIIAEVKKEEEAKKKKDAAAQTDAQAPVAQ